MSADVRGGNVASWEHLLSILVYWSRWTDLQVHKVNIQGKIREAWVGGISEVETEKEKYEHSQNRMKNIRKSGSLFIKDS